MIRTIAVVVLCLFANLAHAQRGALRVASQFEWRQDVEFLAEELPKLHPEPWARVSEEEFRAAVAELDREITGMSEGMTTFEISRLVAMLGDQNTVADVSRPMRLAPVLPLRFVSLADGLYITSAATRYRGMIGGKLLAVGGVPIDVLSERVAAYAPWENETTRDRVVRDLLCYSAVLGLCGIENNRFDILIDFELDGEQRSRQVAAIPLGGTHAWTHWNQLTEVTMPVSVVAAMSPYISAFLGAEANATYVSVTTHTEDPRLPFDDFVSNLMEQIDQDNPARVIIDLRFNEDRGDSIVAPLLNALDDKGWFETPGDVVVLVGKITSATSALDAMRFAERGAVLIGVPTGGNPGGCSGEQDLVLPNSGMTIRVSTRGRTDPGTTTLMPDVVVPWTKTAFFSASDPALDAAIGYKPETTGDG